MEHLLPHKHPLPKPELLKTPAFNELLARVKTTIIGHLKKSDPAMATEVEKTLENPAEVMTKWTEAITVILQNQTREFNDLALQMFGMYARDDKLIDVIVSSLGLKRQVITLAQPDANPPVEAVMEKNDDLLTRFFLAVHSLASTGTKLGYRYHALTLGGKPEITVTSPEAGKVVVEYAYKKHPFAGQTKDAVAKQVSPGVVDVFILAHAG
ncbi:MAG: hypothetical protein OIF58_15775, partial [Cohaesibacter sp.]|nr:hypothetical protein [Cohaesibacter sp.]